MNDLLSDLTADLNADLRSAPPLALPTAPPVRPTPAFELAVTPLRWSRPALDLAGGVSLRVGPLSLGVGRR